MTNTTESRPPTMAELDAAARPYEHIDELRDPYEKIAAARKALLGLVPPDRRLEAGHLVHMIDDTATLKGEEFVSEELEIVARHFGPLQHVLWAVYDHVEQTRGGHDACGCPVGKAPEPDPGA